MLFPKGVMYLNQFENHKNQRPKVIYKKSHEISNFSRFILKSILDPTLKFIHLKPKSSPILLFKQITICIVEAYSFIWLLFKRSRFLFTKNKLFVNKCITTRARMLFKWMRKDLRERYESRKIKY